MSSWRKAFAVLASRMPIHCLLSAQATTTCYGTIIILWRHTVNTIFTQLVLFRCQWVIDHFFCFDVFVYIDRKDLKRPWGENTWAQFDIVWIDIDFGCKKHALPCTTSPPTTPFSGSLTIAFPQLNRETKPGRADWISTNVLETISRRVPWCSRNP